MNKPSVWPDREYYEKTAKRVFVHYMTVTWDKQGIPVDGDNIAEWQDIITNTINAAIAGTLAALEDSDA